MRLICGVQAGEDRDEVTCVEVSLGNMKVLHSCESDEKEIRKSEYLKMLGVKVGGLIPVSPNVFVKSMTWSCR